MRDNVAVIWDMDGVITDTAEFHYITWRDKLNEIGVEFKREDFVQFFGMKNHAVLENVMKKKLEPEFVENLAVSKEEEFRRMLKGNIELLPGVKKCLGRFAGLGWKQALASSARQENIDATLSELGIEPYFDDVFSGDDPDTPDKSNPTLFLRVAEALKFAPQDCIVIEDSIAGVTGAKKAGMKCIAVTTTNPADRLSSADLILDSLSELTDAHLQSIFQATD